MTTTLDKIRAALKKQSEDLGLERRKIMTKAGHPLHGVIADQHVRIGAESMNEMIMRLLAHIEPHTCHLEYSPSGRTCFLCNAIADICKELGVEL